MFIKISLFSNSRFGSGREVSLSEKDIQILQNIADEISSVDYSERKLYLKELICDKK